MIYIRRRVFGGDEGEFHCVGAEAELGEVVLYRKSDGELIFVNSDDLKKFPESRYHPVGIVVIPGHHGVLRDGSNTVSQCGVVSLHYMSSISPEGGSLLAENLRGNDILNSYFMGKLESLGRYDDSEKLLTCNKIPISDYYNSGYDQPNSLSNLFNGNTVRFPLNGDLNHRYVTVSPYAGDDDYPGQRTQKGSYYTNLNILNGNDLADFRGIQYTYTDYKNLSEQENSAIGCISKYHTPGTKSLNSCSLVDLYQGSRFWYLPTLGEIGYLFSRRDHINEVRTKITNGYSDFSSLGDLSASNTYYPTSSVNTESIQIPNVLGSTAEIRLDDSSVTYQSLAFMRL